MKFFILLIGGAACFLSVLNGSAQEPVQAPAPVQPAPETPAEPLPAEPVPVEAQLQQALAELAVLRAQLDELRAEMDVKDRDYGLLDREVSRLRQRLAEESEARIVLERRLAVAEENGDLVRPAAEAADPRYREEAMPTETLPTPELTPAEPEPVSEPAMPVETTSPAEPAPSVPEPAPMPAEPSEVAVIPEAPMAAEPAPLPESMPEIPAEPSPVPEPAPEMPVGPSPAPEPAPETPAEPSPAPVPAPEMPVVEPAPQPAPEPSVTEPTSVEAAPAGADFRGTGEFTLHAGDRWLGDGESDVFRVESVAPADDTQLDRADVDAFGERGVVEQGAQFTRMTESGLYTLIVMRVNGKAGTVELLVQREG